MSLLHVHALIGAPASHPARGVSRAIRVNRRRLQLVPVGPILAAVEPIDAAPPLSEAALRAEYALVIRLFQRFPAVLPVRYGAVVEPAELRRVVAARQQMLTRALDAVNGRAQMTVRVFDPRPAEGSPQTRPSRTGAAYLRGRRAAARPAPPAIVHRIRRAVKPLVTLERLDAGRGGVRASLHHLIAQSQARRYRALVDVVVGRAASPRVTVTGPWPPFAFTPDLWP